MISVVISNYNGEAYLDVALQSVLDQAFRDYEAILVDDGSTDRSVELMRDFADRAGDRFQVIVHEQNRGQAEGFNTGVRAARGSVICFLDSDDFWFPDKLGVVHDAFTREPELAIFQHNLRLFQDGQMTNRRFREYLVTGDGLKYALETGKMVNFVPTAGLAVSRDALMKIMPIPATFRLSADGFMTRTVMCHGLIEATHQCLGAYRMHEHNGTFENNNYDMNHYLHGQLIPALNAYYASINCPLRYNSQGSGVSLNTQSPQSSPSQAVTPTVRFAQRLKNWLQKTARGTDSLSR